MASGLYNLTKDVWLTTGLNLLTLQVDGILINTDPGGYTVNFDTDEFYDPAVPAGGARRHRSDPGVEDRQPRHLRCRRYHLSDRDG